MDAAIAAFAERGVLGSSVEEICETAGFTRGAFYSNFTSRDELCIAVLERRCDELLTGAADALSTARLPSASVDEVLDRSVGFFVAQQGTDPHVPVAMAELRLYVIRQPRVRPAYAAVDRAVNETFLRLVGDELERSGLRFSTDPASMMVLLKALFENHLLDELAGVTTREALKPLMASLLRHFIEPADG